MTTPRSIRLVYSLLLVLLCGAVVPCDLGEIAAACCEDTPVAASQVPAGDDGGDAHVDCCSACLTCCATSPDAAAPHGLGSAGTAEQPGLSAGRSPTGSPLSIWRPPRG